MKAAGALYAIPCSRYVVKEQGLPTPVGPDWQPRSTLLVLLLTDLQHLFNSAGATVFLVTKMSLYRPTSAIQTAFTNQLDIRRNVGSCSLARKASRGKRL